MMVPAFLPRIDLYTARNSLQKSPEGKLQFRADFNASLNHYLAR